MKSGTRRDGRRDLQILLECVREGDVVVVTRINRLARSVKDLQDLVLELREKGVSLRATAPPPIDTSTVAGKAFLDMLGCSRISKRTRERQLEGIAKAKAAGVYAGQEAVARCRARKDAFRGGEDADNDCARVENQGAMVSKMEKQVFDNTYLWDSWRRRRDSNPRDPFRGLLI